MATPAAMEMAEERRRPLTGIDLPAGRPVYWFHAVSMGEVGVAAVLIRELKAQSPGVLAVISTSTASGHEAAMKITGADDDRAEARRLGANGTRMVEDSRGVAARIVEDVLRRTSEAEGGTRLR
jgi:hypothetical protein